MTAIDLAQLLHQRAGEGALRVPEQKAALSTRSRPERVMPARLLFPNDVIPEKQPRFIYVVRDTAAGCSRRSPLLRRRMAPHDGTRGTPSLRTVPRRRRRRSVHRPITTRHAGLQRECDASTPLHQPERIEAQVGRPVCPAVPQRDPDRFPPAMTRTQTSTKIQKDNGPEVHRFQAHSGFGRPSPPSLNPCARIRLARKSRAGSVPITARRRGAWPQNRHHW